MSMQRTKRAANLPLESKVTKAIIKYLKERGAKVWCFKVAGGAYQQRGVPDLVCCVDGMFVALEVKRPEVGRLTDLQAHTIESIRAASGVAGVVTSVAEAAAVVDELLGERDPEVDAQQVRRDCTTCIRWGAGSVPSECYDPCRQCYYDQGFPNWDPRPKRKLISFASVP